MMEIPAKYRARVSEIGVGIKNGCVPKDINLPVRRDQFILILSLQK